MLKDVAAELDGGGDVGSCGGCCYFVLSEFDWHWSWICCVLLWISKTKQNKLNIKGKNHLYTIIASE